MNRRGFTLIEIVITIVLVSILMLLSVVSLNSTLISSRDEERKTDIEAIATNLESFYNSGNLYDSTIGQYPSLDPLTPLTDNDTATNDEETKLLHNIDSKSLIAPGATTGTLSSLIAATNNDQTVAGILPQPTITQYVYQPIASDGSLCNNTATQICRKFNLFYKTEADNIVKMVTSRHQ